jgi:hypothetical protein
VHFSCKIRRKTWSKWLAPKRVVPQRATSRAPPRPALQSAATRHRHHAAIHACLDGPVTLGSCTTPLGTSPSAMWNPRTRCPTAHYAARQSAVAPACARAPAEVTAILRPIFFDPLTMKQVGARLFKAAEPPSRAPAIPASLSSPPLHH